MNLKQFQRWHDAKIPMRAVLIAHLIARQPDQGICPTDLAELMDFNNSGLAYPALRQLQAEGLVEKRKVKKDQRIQAFYALTAKGKRWTQGGLPES